MRIVLMYFYISMLLFFFENVVELEMRTAVMLNPWFENSVVLFFLYWIPDHRLLGQMQIIVLQVRTWQFVLSFRENSSTVSTEDFIFHIQALRKNDNFHFLLSSFFFQFWMHNPTKQRIICYKTSVIYKKSECYDSHEKKWGI